MSDFEEEKARRRVKEQQRRRNLTAALSNMSQTLREVSPQPERHRETYVDLIFRAAEMIQSLRKENDTLRKQLIQPKRTAGDEVCTYVNNIFVSQANFRKDFATSFPHVVGGSSSVNSSHDQADPFESQPLYPFDDSNQPIPLEIDPEESLPEQQQAKGEFATQKNGSFF